MSWTLNETACIGHHRGLLAGLILLLAISAYAQETPTIEVITENAGSSIILRWPVGLKINHRVDDTEIFLSFSHPIENDGLAAIPAQLSSMIEDLQYGYDSLLLRLHTGIEPKLYVLTDGVRIELSRRASYTQEERAQLDYLRALALYNDGQLRQSRMLLKELIGADGGSADTTELLAQIEDELGRGPVALVLAKRSLETEPGSESIQQQHRYLRRTHGDQLRIDTQWQNAERAETQFITRLSGRYAAKPDVSVSGLVENRKVDIDALQKIDGAIADFNGNRQRAELRLHKDWERSQNTQLLLFVRSGERSIGGSIRQTSGFDLGRTTVSLVMNEPYWDLVEGIVDGGSRDRIAFDFVSRTIGRLDAALGVSINRYGIGNDADVAKGIGYTASAQYSLLEDAPYVSVDYALFGRHVSEVEERVNNDGDVFNPLPVVSVEIHHLGLSVSDELWGDRLRYHLAGGYALDRLGGDGPVAQMSLAYETSDSMEIGLLADTYPLLERGQTDFQFIVGGYVMVRF